jgi:16S rRNA (uracil1498-N3)-methyltransferase
VRRLFVPPGQLAAAREGVLSLTAEQARYLGLVLRLRDGDAVEVFDGRGTRLAARLSPLPAGELALRLGEPARDEGASGSIVLAQALSKGEKLDWVVQKATELGVSRIVPFAAERSVVKLSAERGAARVERLRRIAQEAARQCGRADVPQVDAPAAWEELLALPRQDPPLIAVLLDADPGLPPLGQLDPGPRVLLVVGPEGGFSAREREGAAAAGLLAASLGRRVLRTETAGLAAVAIVQHLRGELG